ncbi:MAG: hypothetical protein ABIU20_10295 [Blastocatellia bacterium]
MKPEKQIIAKPLVENSEQDEMVWPEPQTEFGAKIIALAKEIDKSGLPKLSIEEIEEYLGRELGGIAAAYGDSYRKHKNGEAADIR